MTLCLCHTSKLAAMLRNALLPRRFGAGSSLLALTLLLALVMGAASVWAQDQTPVEDAAEQPVDQAFDQPIEQAFEQPQGLLKQSMAGEAEDLTGLGDQGDQDDQQKIEENLRTADALRSQLDDLSSRHGAYDASLLELQTDLGQAYLSAGQVSEAIDVLGQALQLARITDGLYSIRQLLVLQQLMEAHHIEQDWDQVDDYQHLTFMLKSRIHAPESAEYTNALLALGEWRLQALRANLLGRTGAQQSLQLLHRLQEQNEQALGHAKARADVFQQWALLYTQALTDAEISRQYNYQSLTEGFSAVPRYVTQTVCRTVATSNGGSQRVCWQETVSNPDYYNSGANQRRINLERARLRLQATLRSMDALLDENPEFEREHAARTEAERQNLQRVVADLQREARRSTMRY